MLRAVAICVLLCRMARKGRQPKRTRRGGAKHTRQRSDSAAAAAAAQTPPTGDVILPATKRREREPVVGRQLIRVLEDQLQALHQSPAHGNRSLHADHVVVAHLVAFFNPAIASLRRLEDVFEHKQVQRRLGLQRVPRSTLADAQAVFDLNLLQPLVDDLVARIGPLPHDARVGVLRDRVVQPQEARLRFDAPVRLVELASDDPNAPVRLLTSRQDLPAELIGLLYRHRWQIELFFRWIKCCTQLKHFFAESANGMALQLYVAMIGTLLIALEIGARPSVYDFAQMSLVCSGMVSLEDAKVVMARRRAISARDAERAAARRAAKKAAE